MEPEQKAEARYVKISHKSIIYAILTVSLFFCLYYLRDLIFVFLTSIVLSSFVEFGVKKLRRFRIKRTLGVVIIYFVTLGVFGLLFYLFVPILIGELAQFVKFIHIYLPAKDSLSSSLPFPDLLANLELIATKSSQGALQVASAVFGGAFNLILLIVLSFYLSINVGGIETFLRIVSPRKKADYVVGLWKRTEHKIGLWFQGQLLLGLLVGVLVYLGLLIFNIKYALLLAAVSAVFELIPFGIVLAAVPAIAAGFTSSGTSGALTVAALYLIIQQFENNLIQPLVVQKVVGISSLVVILSLLVGVQLAGFWGFILSVPAAVLLMEFLNDIQMKKGLLPPIISNDQVLK